jgi:heme exporter protein C
LALVGFVNIPIIKFSVDWWNTLHQPASVIKMDGPAIHSSMLIPLILMALAFKAFYIWVMLMRIRGKINEGKIQALRLRQVNGGPPIHTPAPETVMEGTN